MKTLTQVLGVILLLLTTTLITAVSTNAMAQVTIDQLQVQGYIQQSNGTAVTNSGSTGCGLNSLVGGYAMAFAVFDNSDTTAIWGTEQCVAVTNGLFSVNLSGVGADLSGLPSPTVGGAMASSFTGATLNAALLAAGTGELTVHVYAMDAINTLHPLWTITITAVPTAMLAKEALTVINNSINFSSLGTSNVYSNLGGASGINGGHGLLVQANTSGYIDPSFLSGTSALPINEGGTGVTTSLTQNGVLIGEGASAIQATAVGATGTVLHGNTAAAPTFSAVSLTADVTGTLPVTNGGTGLNSATTGDINYASGANTVSALGIGGTGTVLYSNGTIPSWANKATIGYAGSGANSDITSLTGLTTPLAANYGGTGLATFTAAGALPYASGATTLTTLAGAGTNGSVLTYNTGTTAPQWTPTLGVANGGTGLNTHSIGDLEYASAATTLSSLPIGTSGQILTSTGTAPAWKTVNGLSNNNIYSANTRVKQFFTWKTAAAAASVTNLGFETAPTITGSTAPTYLTMDAQAAPGMEIIEGTANAVASVNSGGNADDAVFLGWNPGADFLIASTGTAADLNTSVTTLAVGFSSTSLDTACPTASIACNISPSTNADQFVGFFYSTSETAAADFNCTISSGTTTTILDSGVAFTLTAETFYDLYVTVQNGSAQFYINGTQVCSGISQANMPSLATADWPIIQLTGSTATRKFVFSHMILNYK